MNPRDEHLYNVIDDAIEWAGQESISLADHITAAVRASGYSRPRVVETKAELDALPPLAGIWYSTHHDGIRIVSVVEKTKCGSWMNASDPYDVFCYTPMLPATVLYVPGETP